MISSTGTVGSPFIRGFQVAPASIDTKIPTSLPTKTKFSCSGCSSMTFTDDSGRIYIKPNDIIKLIPHCDTITKLDSFCIPCSKNKKISKAIFTKRISQSTETLLIGGKESYIPTCRKCYNKMPDSESNILDRYKKDEDGNYWFNIIPDNVKESFKNDVMQSAVQYLSDMANSYQISIKNHEKFQEYVAAVSEWLKN